MSEDKPHILLIDDEAIALSNLSHVLEREGYTVTACKNGESGLAAMQNTRFDLVLTDLRMPGIDGMDVLRHIRETTPEVPVIMITGHATLDSAVEAMKAGAHHYIAKPFRLDEAREVVRSALELGRIRRENMQLKERIEHISSRASIITQDLGMQRLLDTARQIAATDTSVVIHGESGTGKELLASFIHQHSQRAEGPFVAFNCGALHEEIAASELFGHEKGAFTGATQAKTGLLESADGDTVFLDEIGELPLAAQARLLPAQVRQVGGVPGIKFGLAFCEASGDCLVRWTGTDEDMIELAKKNALAIGAGHSFILFLADVPIAYSLIFSTLAYYVTSSDLPCADTLTTLCWPTRCPWARL